MSFYSDAAALAKRMIAEKGESCVMTTYVDSSDQNRPWVGTRVPVNTTVNAVFLPTTKPDATYEDGTLVQLGDKTVFLIDARPTVGATFKRLNGETWIVAGGIQALDPGGSPLLYECGVRR